MMNYMGGVLLVLHYHKLIPEPANLQRKVVFSSHFLEVQRHGACIGSILIEPLPAAHSDGDAYVRIGLYCQTSSQR